MRRNSITPRESIYLDLVRAAASFIVLIGHAASMFDLPNAPLWGHQAVMVFFVLSGYVICNTADIRERTLRVFVIARFARLWSVLVPAIALTIACDLIGRRFGAYPDAYANVPADLPLIRTVAILTFTSETWLSIQPFSDGAVWSLCVEFWYYMLFAAWCFLPRGLVRTAAICLAALMGGHKALLLLPIWLMGVALQRSTSLRRLNPAANLILFVSCGATVLWIMATRAYDPAIQFANAHLPAWLMHQLAEVRVFWLDWLVGALVAAHLLGAKTVMARLPVERFATPVRRLAGVSFAAYLFHMPLLNLCRAFLPANQGLLAIALTSLAIALLGPPAERSKRWWRQILNRIANAALSALAPALRLRLARLAAE